MSGIISLEDAINSRFENSTRDELFAYAEQLGIGDVRITTEYAVLRSRVMAALGVVDNLIPGSKEAPRRVFRSKIVPDVNLTPNGRWGGRRRRIQIPRPATATKSEKAIPIGWNGKATYWLPFDEVASVPYPIYNILRETKLRRPVQKVIEGIDGVKEITTAWEFDDFILRDFGDDAVTAHLPASLTGWYQDKGYEFYKDLSDRDLQAIAQRLDVNIIGRDGRRVERTEMLDAILIFLFGVSSDSVEEAYDTDPSPADPTGADRYGT